MNAEPVHDGFMDDDMKRLWRELGPLPGGLRLYGGTALALYRNHRRSTDFDFATPEAVVDLAFVGALPWLKGMALNGGPGMVDAVVEGASRKVTVTFMECGHLLPMPTHSPIAAPNGVPVAHPVDLVAAKIEACSSRAAQRDYVDVAEAIAAWPDWCREACQSLAGRRLSAVGRVLATPPREVAAELASAALQRLQAFARDLTQDTHGLGK